VYDNLSRAGTEKNLEWLLKEHPGKITPMVEDIRNTVALAEAVREVTEVYHFAAQVAVTTSLVDPVADFEVNARGALNVLEAVRARPHPPALLYTSTNKVYGALGGFKLREGETRYAPEPGIPDGVSEAQPLDFHSPYGCSKGAADQYVLDYARMYGLPTVVFRMSCIYGPHQHGTEDQGWVAHFVRSAIAGRPLTVYGDGKQVRDILYVEDLIDAFELALFNMESARGRVFNIGGGPRNTVSLLELLRDLERIQGGKIAHDFGPWRHGDQPYYVSDISGFEGLTGWTPQVGALEGLERLYEWLHNHYSTDKAPKTGV
jgi:CDP-paratose 2-epimerase